jgi:hypothetical protein
MQIYFAPEYVCKTSPTISVNMVVSKLYNLLVNDVYEPLPRSVCCVSHVNGRK